MYQGITIVGKVKNEQIELRYTPAGSAVANLNISTYRKYTDSDGSQKYENVYFRVSVWGKTAESCQKYLHKDSVVLITGRLTPDKQTGSPRVYQKNDGTQGASFEVFADTVRFLDSKSDTSAVQQTQEDTEPEF